MLSEDSRMKLDGIVQKMIANKEADADIQFVVNDFKSKYDAPGTPQPTAQTNMSWGDVASNAVTNAPKSAADFGKSLIQPILHPIDTGTALTEMALGGIEKIMPGTPKGGKYQEKFDALIKMLSDRYGGVENIKRTIANDPVGSLADASTVLTGGGTLAAKAPGMVGRAGAVIGKTGAAIDPLTLAGKVVAPVVNAGGKLAAGSLGFTTGGGRESINKAFQAGQEGIPEFTQAMRGNVTGEELRSSAKSALQVIKDDRAADYQKRLANLQSNNSVFPSTAFQIDPKPVRDRTAQLEKMYNIKRDPKTGELDFSRSTLDRNAIGDVENVIKTVEDWGSQPGDLMPVGMDILKRKLDDFYSDSKNSRGFVTSLKNVVKDTIINQVPEYKTMLKNYEQSSAQISEIETALSLGTRSGADTGIRKLISALKDNNEFRGSLIKILDDANGGELAAKIAGYNLSPLTPTRLVGQGLSIGAVSSLFYGFSPQVAVALTMASPRIVGELVQAIGYASKQADKVKKIFPTGVRQGAFQAGRAAQIAPIMQQ